MSDFPAQIDTLVSIYPDCPEASLAHANCTSNGFWTSAASAAWPAANRAIFYPFLLHVPTVLTKLWCLNGNTVSGNLDIGIYDVAGTKLVSTGSTAQSGTSALQTVTITALPLAPGTYYMAMAMDNTTGTLYRITTPTVNLAIGLGWFQQATAFPLPATFTPASLATGYWAWFGAATARFV